MLEDCDSQPALRVVYGILRWAAIMGIALSAAACVRQGPPAPVVDRTGAYNGRATRSPVIASHSTSPPQPQEQAAAAPSPGRIESAPLSELSPPPVVNPAKGYLEVQVNPGETLYAISRTYNMPIRPLIDINHLEPPYSLRAGQKIKVPTFPVHRVREGDTLTGIARTYGVSVEDLAKTNRLERPYSVAIGSRLLIPTTGSAVRQSADTKSLATPSDVGAVKPDTLEHPRHVLSLPPDLPPSSTPLITEESGASNVASVAPVPVPTGPAASTPPAPPPDRRSFLWPVKGSIASPFGAKPGGLQNDGVNIAALRGTPVHAAEDGVVVYAGNELRGYGNLLLIRHAGGWMTAYAHNDQLLVKRGDHVRRGQTIAKVGGTGAVSSPQLHFELRQRGHPVDPLQVMGPM